MKLKTRSLIVIYGYLKYTSTEKIQHLLQKDDGGEVIIDKNKRH